MKRRILRDARRALNEVDESGKNLSGLKLMWYGLALFVYGDTGE